MAGASPNIGLNPVCSQVSSRASPSGSKQLLELPQVEVLMKDLYELLRQKEAAIERVRKEIAALQFVAPLLTDDGDTRRTGESPSSWRKDA